MRFLFFELDSNVYDSASLPVDRIVVKFMILSLVHGAWGNWGNWTECRCKFGEQLQTRERFCNSPAPNKTYYGRDCEGENQQTKICVDNGCRGIFLVACTSFYNGSPKKLVLLNQLPKGIKWSAVPLPCLTLYPITAAALLLSIKTKEELNAKSYRMGRFYIHPSVCPSIPPSWLAGWARGLAGWA